MKSIAKDTGLEILQEDEEISDMDGRSKEQRAKIVQLEDSLKASKASQKKVLNIHSNILCGNFTILCKLRCQRNYKSVREI